MRACRALRVFVTATNVRTGRPRVFGQDDLSLDALLASACLPHLYQAVEIDGDPYWDGGYMGMLAFIASLAVFLREIALAVGHACGMARR